VLVDGAPARSCLMFGVQADGSDVTTVEGLADGEQLSDLQQAFSDHHALQCGFCTPSSPRYACASSRKPGVQKPHCRA